MGLIRAGVQLRSPPRSAAESRACGSVSAVTLNHQSIDEEQLRRLMSWPPVRLAFMSGHQQNNALMKHCHIPSRRATRGTSN